MVQLRSCESEDESGEFCVLYNSVIASFDWKTGVPEPSSPISLQRDETDHPLKLCVLGAKGVGKTAIIVRYLTRRFIGEYRSQIDVSYRHVVSIASSKNEVDILDFSPKNDEDLMPAPEILNSDCFLVVFSIADRLSFLKAVNIVSLLRSFPSSAGSPLTLLGNKKDLEHSRQISTEELENISCLLKCDCSEVSVAESREDILPIMFSLIKNVLSKTMLSPGEVTNLSVLDIDDPEFRSSSVSEPCLLDQSRGNFQNNNVEMKEDIMQQFKSGKTKYEVDRKKEKDSSEFIGPQCQVCREIHHYKNGNYVADTVENKNVKSSEVLFKKIRTSNDTKRPLIRTRSLQGKEGRSKHDSKLNKMKNYSKNNSFRVSNMTDMKKDSKLSSLLNCSRSSEEPEASSFCYSQNIHCKDSPSPKNESRPITSLFIRGRSFAVSDDILLPNKGTRKSNTYSKVPLKSRRTLPSRFLSSETNSKPNETKKNAFESPKSPSKRNSQTLPPEKTKPFPLSSRPPASPYTDYSPSKTLDSPSATHMDLGVPVPGGRPKITEKRERKFGVFGMSVLGNVFSKRSLPDLPRATASFYTKIDSLKKTIQKRSI